MNDIIGRVWDDVAKEVLANKKQFQHRREIKHTIAKELYDRYRYDNPIVLKHLKRELPLSVRLFNKITMCSQRITEYDSIQYGYYYQNKFTKIY